MEIASMLKESRFSGCQKGKCSWQKKSWSEIKYVCIEWFPSRCGYHFWRSSHSWNISVGSSTQPRYIIQPRSEKCRLKSPDSRRAISKVLESFRRSNQELRTSPSGANEIVQQEPPRVFRNRSCLNTAVILQQEMWEGTNKLPITARPHVPLRESIKHCLNCLFSESPW